MLAILHLSDIHFRSGRDNPICARAKAIAAAAASACRDAKHLVIIVSGDIAFAGLQAEFALATDFFRVLQDELSSVQQLTRNQTWLVLPGNHDCDHSMADQLRKPAIGREYSNGHPAETTIKLALGVQSNYRDFERQCFARGEELHPLVNCTKITVGQKLIAFNMVNAAWCSTNPEGYGQLWLPEAAISAIGSIDADLCVTALHYPLSWFDGHTQRSLRKAIDTSAQLVLTGHEHLPDARTVVPAHGYACEHIAAGQLQDEGTPETSHFSVLQINPNTGAAAQLEFSWESDRAAYQSRATSRHFRLVKRRIGGSGDLLDWTEQFESFLDDLGTPVTHPNPNARLLRDFFVWPDARVATGRGRGQSRIASTSEILVDGSKLVVIAGAERSGKTSLGKRLILELKAKGMKPLWLDISQIERHLRVNLDTALRHAVNAQYGAGSDEPFLGLPPNQKVVVVDDLHLLSDELDREEILRGLSNRFGRVVLLVSEDWIAEQTASADRFPELFSSLMFRLLPFGPRLRYELISKWVFLTPSLRTDPHAGERAIERFSKSLDGLIGHDLVAPYPGTLLVMLQTLSAQGVTDVNHGSLGHTYHTLIYARLSAGTSVALVNMRIRLLTELAWAIFESGGGSWGHASIQSWRVEHSNRFSLGHEADDVLQQLCKCGMLENRGGMWHFRHKYVYFYFVAEHINQHLHEQRVVDALGSLVLRLHNEDASNIFTFVAFKSRNDVVLKLLLDRAASLHQDAEECDIAKSCPHFDSLAISVPKLVFDHEQRDRVRAEMLASRDGDEHRTTKSYSARDNKPPPASGDGMMQEFIASVRLITVLGQVVRNHAGQLEASKMRSLVSATYSLSTRALSTFLVAAESEREDLVRDVVAALKDRDGSISLGELQAQVSSRLIFMIELASYGILRHAGMSVGMGELVGHTLQQVLDGSSNSSVDLIDASIQLDKSKVYPRERILSLADRLRPHPFALGVLRLMCLNNFYLFRVPDPDRQAVCTALEIDVDAPRLYSSRAKLPMTRLPTVSTFKQRPAKPARRGKHGKKRRRGKGG